MATIVYHLVCGFFRDLGEYDYRPGHEVAVEAESDADRSVIDVDILGHIFEQSITDLERLRNELAGLAEPLSLEKHKSRRKKEGAFYTPAFITRYIIEQALGGVLRDRFERLRRSQGELAKSAARAVLADPRVYDLDKLKKPQRDALVQFWEAWQDELAGIRLLDPACGSGAFLIEAFDQLHAAYQASNDRLEELRGHRTLFDLDRQILQNNLYGVDVNEEAIEICRLSLWIKTAQRGKVLTSLDHTIRVGNSVVSDPAVDPKAFDWQAAFPEVFGAGGFDVVVANPPYVRQELLSPIKPYLETAFRAYHGMADLYVYFFEQGLRVLKPGGRLSFVVTNKWMKASYGEPLRRLLAAHACTESVVDFGHAKQIFEEADVFPSIIVVRRPTDEPKPTTTRVCAIPREQLRIDDLSRQIESEGFEIKVPQLGSDAWQLEPAGVTTLLAKLRDRGDSLAKFAGTEPLSGIKTGLNDAFLVNESVRKALLAADSRAGELLRPYLRGQDFSRWNADWDGLWMLALKSSDNHEWPWADAGERAEKVFATTYPAVHAHLNQFREALIKRQDQGRFWWELRSCAYWTEFDRPKVMYPEITWRAEWSFDTRGMLCNNTAYILPCDDLWILTVTNAPISWWFAWRNAVHGKDEALRFIKEFVRDFPIPRPNDEQRQLAETMVRRLIEITRTRQSTGRDVLDWLRVELEIDKPSTKLASPLDLDSDAFVAEIKKLRGKKNPLTSTALKSLRDEHARSIAPTHTLAAEALSLERKVKDLVNGAYGLTAEEVGLMWKTAPPRMPQIPSQD